MKRHRHQEFIRFLNVIDARVAKKKTVHVIVDNYAAHKHPKVLEWIENHPRFVHHLRPGQSRSHRHGHRGLNGALYFACTLLLSWKSSRKIGGEAI
jgi:hypothetical protein